MEKMREEFEAWWAESMNTIEMDLHRFGNGYSCHETNRCWMAWQASRAALCVELPSGSAIFWYWEVCEALDEVGVNYT